MKDLMIFKNSDFGELTILEIDGKPHFAATECAEMLGYKDAISAIKQHCRWVVKHHVPHPQNPKKTIEKNFITEGDLYRLITHSKLPKAEDFEKWVFDEVLPSIRKHGAYMTPAKIEEVLLNPDTIIQLATALKAEQTKNAKLQLESKVKDRQIAELKPKADYTDRILQSKGTVTVSVISKDYGMSAEKFNKLLHDLKIQYKQGKIWLLYEEYQSCGYTHSKTFDYKDKAGMPQSRAQTQWTQKGRMFLYEFLKFHGILPMIERNAVTSQQGA